MHSIYSTIQNNILLLINVYDVLSLNFCNNDVYVILFFNIFFDLVFLPAVLT